MSTDKIQEIESYIDQETKLRSILEENSNEDMLPEFDEIV